MQEITSPEVSATTAQSFFGSFNVNLEIFQGPLDLLLHLVNREEVSIDEVDLSRIAEEYLQIIENAKRLDLELASEYLVIAATLLTIKSERILTGNLVRRDLGSLEDSSQFYDELRARLKEYEKIKLQADALRTHSQSGLNVFRHFPAELPQSTENEDDFEVTDDAFSLGSYFFQLLKRVGGTLEVLRIKLESIPVVDLMMRAINFMRDSSERKFSIYELARTLRSTTKRIGDAKTAVIGTFISVLELAKRGVVELEQDGEGGNIAIALNMLAPDASSVFDVKNDNPESETRLEANFNHHE
ncbi:segregation/condensation protein A [bacterium]|nr:segregation/condensation protein A [bacterium]